VLLLGTQSCGKTENIEIMKTVKEVRHISYNSFIPDNPGMANVPMQLNLSVEAINPRVTNIVMSGYAEYIALSSSLRTNNVEAFLRFTGIRIPDIENNKTSTDVRMIYILSDPALVFDTYIPIARDEWFDLYIINRTSIAGLQGRCDVWVTIEYEVETN